MSTNETDWFRCPIDRKALKTLMRRSDRQAILHFGGYFLIVILAALQAWFFWGTWWSVPAFLLYGTVWAFANAALHETCHGTPFRSRWLNDAALWIAGWMIQMEPVSIRWIHAGHHSKTHFEEGDSELILGNPMTWGEFVFQVFGLQSMLYYYIYITKIALGFSHPDVQACVPEQDMKTVTRNARIFVGSYIAITLCSLIFQSWLPVIMLLAPRIISGPMYGIMRVTQHTGLAMNVQDHRQTTRTMYLNPVLQFFYFNMNYHMEHHMFPMVPFHRLPELHALIKDQAPTPKDGLVDTYREILQALSKQQKEPGYYIPKVKG